ncbi:MAG: class I SAM-dependent methyltransferase [Gammaproteobacteria bacterium]|nr:class I SAM-dependent methyltransferase [Gammaproteobacteria bacterium]
MTSPAELAINLVEKGYVPDTLVRTSIRWLIRRRLDTLPHNDSEASAAAEQAFVAMMDASPVALQTDKANEQHYELPASFFGYCLGHHRKYSCCYWPQGVTTLDEAEAAALRQTCKHADIEDGHNILELGCGWGSLSLWMAQNYPNATVTAVSNSSSQREYIEQRANGLGLTNLRVLTADMNDFRIDQHFDRVVSVEMFEHMRNYRELFERIAGWLTDDGRFFMHIFCHKNTPYEFEDRGATDWMSRYFFSGGIMPSYDLPLRFADKLQLDQRWRWDGTHYQKTAETWLQNMDAQRDPIMALFRDTYGDDASRWWMRWRMFYFAVAELFGCQGGEQWFVGHYRFRRNPDQ